MDTETFIIVYIVSLIICLPMRKGEYSFFAYIPIVNTFFAPIMLFGYILDYYEKPQHIKEFHEKSIQIRQLIKNNEAVSANGIYRSLRCPSREFETEFAQLKKEVDSAMELHAKEQTRLETERKRQSEIRQQEQKRQQHEKEKEERARLALLAQSGQILDSLSPQEFELIVLEAFSRQGYKVTHTSYTGDEGVDGFIEKGSSRIAIQCKKYTGSVGQSAIRDFYGAMMHFNCSTGYFIITSDFSEPAKDFIKNKSIVLFDREKTLNLFQSSLNDDYILNGRPINFPK